MQKKILTTLLISTLICTQAFSQISEGGIPPSFKSLNTKSLATVKSHTVTANKQEINKLLREEAFSQNLTKPSPIATIIPVNYDLIKDGEWTILENGTRICRLNIVSPDALGIILTYNKFYIPRNSKLFIYNRDKSQILGAYTNNTNPEGDKFSTEIIYGDELTLEYVEYSDEPAQIIISSIGYGYQGIANYRKNTIPEGFNKSGDCQVNINCSEGAEWQVEKKSVARIYALIGNIWFRSTGSLINNTKNDKEPLFLTAAHCIRDKGIIADMNTIQFYFNYEFAGCSNEDVVPEGYKTMVGADILVLTPFYEGSDGALLNLKEQIPNDYDVYFNGWDISEQAAKSGVVIHHPNGDVKKISTFNTPLATGSYTDNGGSAIQNAHWIVKYILTQNGYGTTEKGSSGSPIFSQNKLVVGTLTGGNSGCGNKSGVDYFGKISYHWDKNSGSEYFMKPYLDPIEAKVEQMTGLANIGGKPIDPPIIRPDANAPEAYTFWSEDKGKNELTVVLKDEKDYIKKITLVSMSGYDIYRNMDIGSNKVTVQTTGWPNGLYIIYVETTEGKKHNFKIVK